MRKKITVLSIVCFLIIAIAVMFPRVIKETYAATTTLADKVISLSKGSSWSSGASGVYQVNNTLSTEITATNYRYVGANVNNYVKFNNDMYRIIGVFDENTHGVEGKQLVKLIRSRILSNCAWGVYNTTNTSGTFSGENTNWTGNVTGVKANLNVLLNEFFYNKTSISDDYGECSDWTYYWRSSGSSPSGGTTENCSDIAGYGINDNVRNYIQEATWYLYTNTEALSKADSYLCERGYDGCTSGSAETYDTMTTANIGLMYISDYMYASGKYSSSDKTTFSDVYFGNQNWLFKGEEYTINARSFPLIISVYSNIVAAATSSTNGVSYFTIGMRPTFYLKSSVYVTGGNGSFDNPYTIACDDCS